MFYSSKIIYSFAILLLVLTLDSSVVAQNIESDPISGLDSLKTRIDSLLSEDNIPGAGIALVHQDSVIWTGGVGYANYETKQPVTSDHLFRAGSVSKSFVALGLMKLVQQGKLSLDDKVHELVQGVEITNPWRKTDPVRVKHLLEHTAGFDDMHFNEMYNTSDDPNMPMKEALSVNPQSRVVRWKPGTRYSYSNPGYAVAGYIIEKVTGQRYEDYLEDEVLEPLGMHRSSFAYTDSVKQKLVTGYQGSYDTVEYRHIYLRPSGALHTSPKEMANFVRMLLNDGSLERRSIISDSLLARMETSATTLAAKHGFQSGYGLGIRHSETQGYPYYGHGGGIAGFISQYMYFPKYELGYALFVNSTAGFSEIEQTITDFLLRDVPKPEPVSSIDLSTEQLSIFEGYYSNESPRNQLFKPLDVILAGKTVSVINDTLRTSGFMESVKKLLPISDKQFRLSGRTMPTTIFMDTEEYGQAMRHDGDFYIKTGSWKKYVYRGAFFGGLGILATFVLFSLFWIPFELYRKFSAKHTPFAYQQLFLWPLGALLSIALLIGAATQLSLMHIGERTFAAIIVMLATYLFGAASIGSLWTTLRGLQKDIHWVMKSYFSLVSLTLIGFTIFFIYWDWMGLRLWAY